MATRKTTKKIYYLRAVRNNLPMDLASTIQAARLIKPNIADSEVTFASGEVVRIQKCFPRDNGDLLIQLTRYVPGERAPTIQPNLAQPDDNEGIQPAPPGREFKDGDCYLLISKHHILFCGHGIMLVKAAHYFRLLFKECGFENEDADFEISAVANQDGLQLLREQGVRSVLLSANAFDMSIPPEQRRGFKATLMGLFSDELGALAAKDETIAEQKAREDLIVNLELKLNGNTKAVDDAQELMKDWAEEIFDDADNAISNFTIVTQSGEQITPEKIRLQKNYRMTITDKSLSFADVMDAMTDYFAILEQGNLIEQ